MFLILLGVRLVQGVEQCRVNEGARPDHARWPHEEPPEQAGDGIPHELGGEADHDLVAVSEVLLVEDFLRQQEIGGVGTKLDDLGHHSDNCVFLDVERTGIQGPDESEGVEPGGGKSPFEESTNGEGNQLHNDTGHKNGRIWEED